MAAMINEDRKFLTMDATRGLAAICVMLFHYFSAAGIALFSSGYVAVDFFFCLSGFIIAYSYGDKLRHGMTPADFFIVRTIRLYPMYLIGTAIGVCVYFIFGAGQVGIVRAILSVPFALLGLPVLFRVPVTFGREVIDDFIFPFNIPAWSLFFEVVLNVLYATMRWSKQGFYLVVTTACVYFFMTTIRDGPSGFSISNFGGGLPRSVLSFSVGVAIFHFWARKAFQRIRISPVVPCCSVLALCLIPYSHTNFLLSVLIAVPFTVIASIQNPASAMVSRLFRLLGELSYPVYTIHVPIYQLVQFARNRVLGLPPSSSMPWPALLIVATAVLFLALLLARWWDGPIRRRMSAEFIALKVETKHADVRPMHRNQPPSLVAGIDSKTNVSRPL
jgi:peptidoglycan/LPS O-acetylase OafA/YrhL